MRTLIIGLGSPIITDDGVGLEVAYEVEKALRNPVSSRNRISGDDITITEASAGGVRLMEAMIGYDRVILIDAFMQRKDNNPGTIHKMTLDDLRDISPTQHSACAHDTTLVTALDAGQRMGLHLPKEITIFAIEVENISEFGEEPTPAVAAAIPKATAMVLRELGVRDQ
ncbi:MAG: hydrogenase maturation protease [Chloroflexi bacterium]|nr:hydrogenase maturation protease [Chloroflexota bacterium]MBU1660960.1 hydrogenase maturation protease [Chloroflexota bacterium]